MSNIDPIWKQILLIISSMLSSPRFAWMKVNIEDFVHNKQEN